MIPLKEPWQMTREEYEVEGRRLYNELGSRAYVNTDFHAYSENVPHEFFGESQQKYPNNSTAQAHYRIIKRALLSEGKPIPPEVLKDYPDLQEQADAEFKRQFDREYREELAQKMAEESRQRKEAAYKGLEDWLAKEKAPKTTGGRKRKSRTPKGDAPTSKLKGIR